jgi:hypothetical protein
MVASARTTSLALICEMFISKAQPVNPSVVDVVVAAVFVCHD